MGICDVIQNGGQDSCYLRFYSSSNLSKYVFARVAKYDIIKHFAALSSL